MVHVNTHVCVRASVRVRHIFAFTLAHRFRTARQINQANIFDKFCRLNLEAQIPHKKHHQQWQRESIILMRRDNDKVETANRMNANEICNGKNGNI